MFALLSRMLGRSALLEDLAQETFLRAHRAFARFELERAAKPSTWLLTIATRVALDHIKQRVPPSVPFDSIESLAGGESPEQLTSRRRLGQAIEAAAAQLGDEQRAAFVLFTYHGLSVDEIASAFECAPATVKTRLFRARQRMPRSDVSSAAPANAAPGPISAAPEPRFVDAQRVEKILAALESARADFEGLLRASGAPGFAWGFVIDDKLALAHADGKTSLVDGAKVTSDTVFRLGSITKVFTALAVLRLRDEGRLALDAPMTTWLPEFGGVVYPTRDSGPITPRHLLLHASGLPRLGNFEYTLEGHAPGEAEVLGALAGAELRAVPGAEREYSNFGYSLLGMLVSRAAGQPFDLYIREKVLRPLGMTHTVWDAGEVPKGLLARPHRQDVDVDTPARRLLGSLFDAGVLPERERTPSLTAQWRTQVDAALALGRGFDVARFEQLFDDHFRQVIPADKSRPFLEGIYRDNGSCHTGDALDSHDPDWKAADLRCERGEPSAIEAALGPDGKLAGFWVAPKPQHVARVRARVERGASGKACKTF